MKNMDIRIKRDMTTAGHNRDNAECHIPQDSISLNEIGGDMTNLIVKNDVGRAWTWAQLFARSVDWETGQPRRPTNF